MKRTLKPLFAFATLSVALLLLGLTVSAQEKRTTTGTVRDTAGLAVPGVTVRLKGTATNKGAITDENGVYTVKANAGDVLVFSSIGYTTQEVTVGAGTLNVLLMKNSAALGEAI